MLFQALRHRFLWRQRAPIDPGEIRRIERWLATARVFLAISALVAVRMDPGGIGYSFWAYGLLAFYIAQGVVVILLLRRREQSTVSFRRLVHAADIVWPALISIFATGAGQSFFPVLRFRAGRGRVSLGGMGDRCHGRRRKFRCCGWRAWRFTWVSLAAWTVCSARYHLPLLGVQAADFEPKRLFMLSIYLLVMGLLLGYLAEQQKQLRSEKAVIARILGKVRVEAGLSGTLQDIVGELLVMYGAERALIASQEATGHRVYVGEMLLRNGEASFFRWLDPLASDRETYLFDYPAETSYAWRNGHQGKRKLHAAGPRPCRAETSQHLAGISRPAGATASLQPAHDGFVCLREGMVGPNFLSGTSADGRDHGRAAFPAGTGTADWPGGVQRVSAAALAVAGRGPGTRTLCPRTSRWRGAVADRGGDAGGCAAAPVGDQVGSRSRRNWGEFRDCCGKKF